jgi:hypothetical protein
VMMRVKIMALVIPVGCSYRHRKSSFGFSAGCLHPQLPASGRPSPGLVCASGVDPYMPLATGRFGEDKLELCTAPAGVL